MPSKLHYRILALRLGILVMARRSLAYWTTVIGSPRCECGRYVDDVWKGSWPIWRLSLQQLVPNLHKPQWRSSTKNPIDPAQTCPGMTCVLPRTLEEAVDRIRSLHLDSEGSTISRDVYISSLRGQSRDMMNTNPSDAGFLLDDHVLAQSTITVQLRSRGLAMYSAAQSTLFA